MEVNGGDGHKRKELDSQEGLASSSSVPVINIKKRRIEESAISPNSSPARHPSRNEAAENLDPRENIKKHVQVIKDYVGTNLGVENAIEAVRDLKRILGVDKKEHANTMVEEGVVSVLIQHLKTTSASDSLPTVFEIMDQRALNLLKYLVKESDSARRAIIDEGMIAHFLLFLRRRHRHADDKLTLGILLTCLQVFDALSRTSGSETARALVTMDNDGIELTMALLSPFPLVQRYALQVITALISRNDEYRDRVGKMDFVCQLTVMLSSKEVEIRRGAASVIVAMFSISQPPVLLESFIANEVQYSIVSLLDSSDTECRSLGAKLVKIFVDGWTNIISLFTEIGAVRSLVRMLKHPNLRRDAVFALHSLPTEITTFAIIHEGGLQLVLDMFLSPDVQHDRELASVVAMLFLHLATSQPGTPLFIKTGGLRLLRTAKLHDEMSRELTAPSCWEEIHKNLMDGTTHTARSLAFAIRESDAGERVLRARCAQAFALFTDPFNFRGLFLFNQFLGILVELYASANPNDQYDGAEALYNIASESVTFLCKDNLDDEIHAADDVDGAFCLTRDIFGQTLPPPVVQVPDIGLRYVNNPNYDITFSLENNTKKFQAHRCVLKQASNVFRAMLSDDIGNGTVEISNIKHATFVSVMQFLYTGRLQYSEVDDAYAILEAADIYGLDCLKNVCEYLIAREHIVVERVAEVYDFAERFGSKLLMHVCIIFILEFHEQVRSLPSFGTLVQRILPEIREWFPTIIPGSRPGSLVPTSGF